MREIGSEFWLNNIPNEYIEDLPYWLNVGDDRQFLLSGRTAIDFVLEDISQDIRCVYMPSYCCESILQPFVDQEIHIEFYDVVINDKGIQYLIDDKKDCDIFFAISYFGFSCTTMDEVIETFSKRGIIVIEDITHRLLSEQLYKNAADYYVASLRKWFEIPAGGLAVKSNGKFSKTNLTDTKIVETKICAMRKKADYINFQKGNKDEYLNTFASFNKALQQDYKDKKMDYLSKQIMFALDISEIKKRRKNNAKILYKSLGASIDKIGKFIKPLIAQYDIHNDCPLFFPIRVRADLRKPLRDFLTLNKIYCPIHWPIAKNLCLNERTRQIYDEELSLICDHRYGQNEMLRIVNTIKVFFEGIEK